MDQIELAAKMAGDWWAERLFDAHAEKRETFSAVVAKKIDAALRIRPAGVKTSVDYDPQGLMLEAVREVINPQCSGMMFSASGILPQKHDLKVEPFLLTPKEGYGNWTAPIVVPNVK